MRRPRVRLTEWRGLLAVTLGLIRLGGRDNSRLKCRPTARRQGRRYCGHNQEIGIIGDDGQRTVCEGYVQGRHVQSVPSGYTSLV